MADSIGKSGQSYKASDNKDNIRSYDLQEIIRELKKIRLILNDMSDLDDVTDEDIE